MIKLSNYVVTKAFLDRFDDLKHCKPGDPHTPPNEERAQQLLKQGFIAVAKEKIEMEPKKRKPRNKAVTGGDLLGETDES